MGRSLARRLAAYFQSLFRRPTKQSDLDEEIQLHIDELTEEYIADGLSPADARKAALKRFGSVEWIKDDTRESWGMQRFLDTLRDFKFGLRLTVKHSTSSVLAVVVLALGIGISTILFTTASKLRDTSGGGDLDDRQFLVEWEVGKTRGEPISIHDFLHLRNEVDSIENFIGIQGAKTFFHLPSQKEDGKVYRMARTSPNFFDLTQEQPEYGRLFNAQDADDADVRPIVVSYSVVSQFFDSAKDAVGTEVVLGDQPCVIIGAMPKGFAFPEFQNIWMPTDWSEFDGALRSESPRVRVTGRLKPGFIQPQAQAELDTIAANLATEYPDTNENYTRIRLSRYKDQFIDDDAGVIIGLALFGSALVLAVACANVFQIVIARTAVRSHELAVRRSLGARRGNVIWQVIVDGLTLSSAGALVGLGIAAVGLDFLSDQLVLFEMPGLHTFQLTPSAIAFVLIAATLSGVVSSIIPAWRASKIQAFDILKDDTKSSGSIYIGWIAKTLVVSQVMFSTLLLFFSMSLLFPSFYVDSVKLPFDKDSLLTVRVGLGLGEYSGENTDVEGLYTDLKNAFMEIPGVQATGLTTAQWGLIGENKRLEVEGRTDDADARLSTQLVVASPDYLDAFGARPISGRALTPFDTKDSLKVCMVNPAFANFHFPGEEAIGKRIRIKPGHDEWITIVGVVPEMSPEIPTTSQAEARMLEEVTTVVILPFTQRKAESPTLLIKADNASHSRYRTAVREALQKIAPKSQIQGSILTMGERLDIVSNFIQSVSRVGQYFGGAILAMSIIGLYSIIAFTTSQRRKEIGIRMAVGSNAWGIAKSVLKPWFAAIAAGLSLAAIAYYALSSLQYLLFSTTDVSVQENLQSVLPLVIPVIGIVIVASLFSMALPAWRAIKIQPMEVIRME